MLKAAIVAMASGILTAGMPEAPSDMLDPLNPALGTHSRQPASPLRGLKPFAPAKPKDWLRMNQEITPSPDNPNQGMHGMPGMGDMK